MKKNNLMFVEAALAYVYKQRGVAYGLMVLFLAVGFSAFTNQKKEVTKKSLTEVSFTLDSGQDPTIPESWSPNSLIECETGEELCGISFDSMYLDDVTQLPEQHILDSVYNNWEDTEKGEPIENTDIRVYKKN